MREFLEDAHTHRDDGYGRAQKHAQRDLPKRFYKETGVAVADLGFTVTLDGRPTKTPGRVPVVVPSAAIATAMAEEWAAQGEHIDPRTMPMVRLVNSTVEGGEAKVPALREEIVSYASNDLMFYRAEGPQALVDEQERVWDAALVKLARHFSVSFRSTVGIVHVEQPPATLARLADTLGEEGLFVVAALASITSLTGSGLLAIAYWHRLMDADEVWAAAHVDEDFNISQWGAVEEATLRRTRRKAEFDAAIRVLDFLRPG